MKRLSVKRSKERYNCWQLPFSQLTLCCALLVASFNLAWVAPARAVVIEMLDVAPDRVERQRAEAIGQLPLPGTPNVGQLTERLAEKNFTLGSPILIRVFKASSELEIWMQRGDRFELFATYPICNWSGTLGPKLTEGDKQSPEGVYTVTTQQLHLIGRHPRSLNLGFPNALDRQMSRTGSYILIHGGCSSVGCFAMTNPVIEEVYSLASAALKGKQDAIQVHVYPFRMTEDRLKAYALNEWYDFWRNLKDVSDSFERSRLPPRISICEGRYWVEDANAIEEVASHGPLAVCAASLVGVALQSNVPGAADPQIVSQNGSQNGSQNASPIGQPWWMPLPISLAQALIRQATSPKSSPHGMPLHSSSLHRSATLQPQQNPSSLNQLLQPQSQYRPRQANFQQANSHQAHSSPTNPSQQKLAAAMAQRSRISAQLGGHLQRAQPQNPSQHQSSDQSSVASQPQLKSQSTSFVAPRQLQSPPKATTTKSLRAALIEGRHLSPAKQPPPQPMVTATCNETRASCRHWVATRRAALETKLAKIPPERRGQRLAARR